VFPPLTPVTPIVPSELVAIRPLLRLTLRFAFAVAPPEATVGFAAGLA